MFNKSLRSQVQLLDRTMQDFLTMFEELSKTVSASITVQARWTEVFDSRVSLIAKILAEQDPRIRERFAAAPNFRDITGPGVVPTPPALNKQVRLLEAQMKTLLKKSKRKVRKKSV